MRNLFRRRNSLADLSYDELHLEKVKLEASEQKQLRDLQEFERQKTTLFEEAKREKSPSLQQVKARQIRDISRRIDILQKNMQRVGKLIQIVDLTMAYQELGADSPLGNILKETDALEIGNWVDEMVTVGTVADQKLDQILKAFGDAQLADSGTATGDMEVDAILAEIQMSAASEALTSEEDFSDVMESGFTESPRSITD
ncbi:hypothetical protein KFU94_46550 [Chloroflexi bacterium TSY]|nr:hypothetical protein [Chloroflexi bacterium TSY]